MAERLEGKVAVVTGASSGIGEATVRALLSEGVIVVAASRRMERLEELAETAETKGAGEVLTIKCDVTEEEQAHDLVRRTVEEFGRIDILVNNAGVMYLSRIENGVSEQWRRMFDVNVLGLLYISQAAIGYMKEQDEGHIVNISSTAGRSVQPTLGVYSATKFAVNAISEALRLELMHSGVRITTVAPGVVATELATHMTDEEARVSMRHMMESMDVLESRDIADAVVFALAQPKRASVSEVMVRPTKQVP